MDTGSFKDAEVTATRKPEVMAIMVAGKPKVMVITTKTMTMSCTVHVHVTAVITTGNPKDAAMMVTRGPTLQSKRKLRNRSDPPL